MFLALVMVNLEGVRHPTGLRLLTERKVIIRILRPTLPFSPISSPREAIIGIFIIRIMAFDQEFNRILGTQG